MTRRPALAAAAAVACLAPAAPADAARPCGTVGRPFTDGGAEVAVAKGRVSCATARGLMRRYWGIRADAFQTSIALRHAGIRWRCRPTTDDFPYRWACNGGGPDRNRFRVTARE